MHSELLKHSARVRDGEAPSVDLCAQFELRWSIGETPRIEEYLTGVPEADQPEAFERLLIIELAYRTLSGETISERQYRERFPKFQAILERVFSENVSLACEDSHLRSQSSTVLWDRIALAANPAVVHQSQDMVDRYRLEERIGRGGFGEVWRATDTELGREVAIKLARSDRSWPENLMNVLRAEARHAASLRHAGIVPVYDIARTAHGIYVVSEFIHGETLAMRLRRGALPTELAVRFAIQIADALHHAHLKGLVHRDVKPGNILLRSTGDEALLTDFGLAVTEVDQLRETRSTVGTWWYMSPEQARGESHRVDARSDVYSLGVVLYQMLTGRLPFVANTREEYVDQLLNRDPRPPRTIDDAIHPELEKICLKCLEKSLTARFTTAADLSAALGAWSQPQVNVEPAAPEAPYSKVRWIGTAFVAVLIGLLALPWLLPDSARSIEGDVEKDDFYALTAPDRENLGKRQTVALDGWIPLMEKQPTMFAWSLGEGRQKPLFDADSQTFAVHAENARWIATTGQFNRDDFEFEAEVSVQDWIGNVGFVWHLASDPRLMPKNAFRCLGIEYQRTNQTKQPRLRLREFVISQHSFDRRLIEHVGSEVSRDVQLPTDEWVQLRCRVNTAKISVKFGEESEWVIDDPHLDNDWQPVLESACGITGIGSNTRVRKLAVRFLNQR